MKLKVLIMFILIVLIISNVIYNRTVNNLEEHANELLDLNDEFISMNSKLLHENSMLRKKMELNEQIMVKLESKLKDNAIVSLGSFEVTAYDLSVKSCGKKPGDKSYGITANGKSLINKSREEAQTIAVDPNIIPLGTEVYLKFKSEKYEHFNGFYTAEDTGGAVKGNIIDLFMGDFNSTKEHKSVPEFGRRKAEVYLIK